MRSIRPALGTFVCVCVREGSVGVEAAFAEIDRLEAIFSEFRPGSAVRALNAAAGRTPVRVPREVAHVLRIALSVARASGGAFDPTFRPLADAWDLDACRVPSRGEVEERLSHVGHGDLVLDGTSAFLRRRGMRIALGGVAKAYIAGRAADAAVAAGAGEVLVDAGGDIAVRGSWSIAVQDPRDRQRAVARIELRDGAVATSGDFERFFESGGLRYHHLLDARTGWPARSCRLATVACADPALADALATALFVLGPQRGRAMLPEDACAFWVDSAGSRIAANGGKGKHTAVAAWEA